MLVYCIGAQKAGTSWLHDQMTRQGRIAFRPGKEYHYWDTWRAPAYDRFRLRAEQYHRRLSRTFGRSRLKQLISARHRDVRDAAREHFDLLTRYDPSHERYIRYVEGNISEAEIVGDFSPAYALLTRATFGEMANVHSNPRFIFILRDPVDRLVSGVKHQNWRRIEVGRLDKKAQIDLVSRSLGDAISDTCNMDYMKSNYQRTLTELRAEVPEERIHVMFYETMFTDEAIAELCRFLGLKPFAPETERKVNVAHVNEYTPSDEVLHAAEKALAPVYRYIRNEFGSSVPNSWRMGNS